MREHYWWKTGLREKPHSDLWSHVSALREYRIRESWKDRTWEQLYENELYSSGGPYAAALTQLARYGFQAARLNVTRSVVDTLVAKIGKRPPAVKATPDAAKYKLRKKAKGLTRFIRGAAEADELDQKQPYVLRDACIVGTGALKVYDRWGQICSEIVPKEELFVDPREARYGRPRQLHQWKVMSKDVLREMFPRHRAAIDNAPQADAREDMYSYEEWGGANNMVDVIESWHLRSGPDADDGRHAIILADTTLLYERWDRDRFPLAFMHYAPKRRGFWGKGLVEQGAELQVKIDQITRDILEALYYLSQARVVAHRNAGVVKSHLGRQSRPWLIEYDGPHPPIIEAPNPVSKDAMMVLEFLERQFYELAGISQMSARAKNPLGAGASGAALAEWYDIESERYRQTEQAYSQFSVDVAELYIDTAKTMAERGEVKQVAKWTNRGVMQRISWKDVDMERDMFNLAIEPTGFLPDTRAGKLDAIERLAKVGLLEGPQLAQLFMDEPDIAKANAELNAARNNLDRVMEELADEDAEFPGIDPHWNLAEAERMAKGEYNRAQADGAPEAVLERFRKFISLVIAATKKAQAAMAPPADPMAMQDPGAGPPMPADAQAGMPQPLPAGPAPEVLPGEALPGA